MDEMRPVGLGDAAPGFTLGDHRGGTVTLSELRGRTVVLNFFPLAFSDVCTAQFRDIAAGAYAGSDAVVLAVSVDHASSLGAFAAAVGAEDVTFLSDVLPHGEVARAYGVWVPERGHSGRATFVIDPAGAIRHADRRPTPLTIPDPAAARGAAAACAVPAG
jgi:mycoredoxin-dependent peroxiredoxin